MPCNMFLSRGGTMLKTLGGEPDEFCGLSWATVPELDEHTRAMDQYFDWGWFFGD